MNVTFKDTIAHPERTPHGFVWWGANEYAIDPPRGLIPWTLRNRLRSEMGPPPGSGGAWYHSERAAVEDLARVVLEILNERKGRGRWTDSNRT